MGILGLPKESLRVFLSVSGGCLEDVLKVFDGCLQVKKRESGGYK